MKKRAVTVVVTEEVLHFFKFETTLQDEVSIRLRAQQLFRKKDENLEHTEVSDGIDFMYGEVRK